MVESRKEWAIYWRDRNLKHDLYDLVEPTPSVEPLLAEIDADPTYIFWGFEDPCSSHQSSRRLSRASTGPG